MNFVRTTLIGAAFFAVCACQSEESRLRDEASRLVELYAQVSYEDAPDVREQKLAAIEQAVFVSPEVVNTRTVCVEGHRALMATQRNQEETAKEIDQAIGQADGAEPLPLDVLERLQLKLSSAQEQVGPIRSQLEACEAQIRALNLRFGKR